MFDDHNVAFGNLKHIDDLNSSSVCARSYCRFVVDCFVQVNFVGQRVLDVTDFIPSFLRPMRYEASYINSVIVPSYIMKTKLTG